MDIGNDPFQLQRFIEAQKSVYGRVLAELQSGRKQSHWMWFIFPQIDGLGFSMTAKKYAIKSADEAHAYLNHNLLGARLVECSQIVLSIEGRSAHDIFGSPDDLKLCSCMTLFEFTIGPKSVFSKVLDKFYAGERDKRTLQLLQHMRL